jgi:hypothetical protein
MRTHIEQESIFFLKIDIRDTIIVMEHFIAEDLNFQVYNLNPGEITKKSIQALIDRTNRVYNAGTGERN